MDRVLTCETCGREVVLEDAGLGATLRDVDTFLVEHAACLLLEPRSSHRAG